MPGPVTTQARQDAIEDDTLRHHGLLGRGVNQHAITPIDYEQLPFEAKHTLNLVMQGAQLPYPHHDGGDFGNRFGDLPPGEYAEFTVPTPGAPNRAMRRLVIRKGTGQVFFTACHYERVGATGGTPQQRQAAILAHAQTIDPLWRNGFYVVTGMSLDLRNRIVAAMQRYPRQV